MTQIRPAALDAFADGLKRKELAMDAPKYDLKAMGYVAGDANLATAFWWDLTPQGRSFWQSQLHDGVTDEERAALAEMKAQWEKENG